MIRLSAKLPTGEHNGLAGLERGMINHPDAQVQIVGVVELSKISTDYLTHNASVTVHLSRVEIVTPLDRDLVGEVMLRALELRSGSTVLPFPTEQADARDEA